MRGDAPRADLLAGHAHVLAVDFVADGVQVVDNIHAAVQQVSVQRIVDNASNATVNDDGAAVRVVVFLGDSLGLIVISSQVERFVQLVNVVGLRTVDRVVGDNVGVAARTESRVSVAKIGHGRLDGLTACLVAIAGGLVADGDGAGVCALVNELLLVLGHGLLHHGWFPLSVLVLFSC